MTHATPAWESGLAGRPAGWLAGSDGWVARGGVAGGHSLGIALHALTILSRHLHLLLGLLVAVLLLLVLLPAPGEKTQRRWRRRSGSMQQQQSAPPAGSPSTAHAAGHAAGDKQAGGAGRGGGPAGGSPWLPHVIPLLPCCSFPSPPLPHSLAHCEAEGDGEQGAGKGCPGQGVHHHSVVASGVAVGPDGHACVVVNNAGIDWRNSGGGWVESTGGSGQAGGSKVGGSR